MESFAYTDAAEIYNNYVEENNKITAETYLKAADANYFINNMRQASMYYEKAFNANSEMEEPFLSRYLRSLRSVRDYKKADKIYIDYLKKSGDEVGLPNVVTSVLASYRGYDTLGETFVIFTAAAGVLAILGRSRRQPKRKRMKARKG